MFSWIDAAVARRLPGILTDAIVVVLGFYVALLLRFMDDVPALGLRHYLPVLDQSILPVIALFLIVNQLWRLDRRAWRYASAEEIISIFLAVVCSTLVTLSIDLTLGAWGHQLLPISVVILGSFFVFSGFVAVRYRVRLFSGFFWRWQAIRGELPATRSRTLIYGAGQAGQVLARRLLDPKERERCEIVGFMDDDTRKHGIRIHGIKVLGGRDDLVHLVERARIDRIVLAMTSINGESLRDIVSKCQETAAQIKVLPDPVNLVAMPNGTLLIREVSVEDLLGRKPVLVNRSACQGVLTDKVVLVTGGCGSIGSELCRKIATFAPRQLVVFDNNESGLFDLAIEMRSLFPNLNLRVIVGNISEPSKVDLLFREVRPEAVFHAAAYKHVPLMEEYPEEAFRVNVLGTREVIAKADEYGCERFVLISTDKAVSPTSVMGMTKRLAELLILTTRPSSACLFTIVRFGNVMGSRGSVVPTFSRQIELGGPITVTHPETTRFFMEISEAASLTIQAASFTNGRDIFMLEMGERIRVDDLARKMIRMRGLRPDIDIRIVYTGLRPGEKLHEELSGAGEHKYDTDHPHIYRINGYPPLDAQAVHYAIEALRPLASLGARDNLVNELARVCNDAGVCAPQAVDITAPLSLFGGRHA